MKSNDIKKKFIYFFNSLGFKTISPIPILLKNNYKLMFVNAGMNAFKDILVGKKKIKDKLLVNSQKCLRITGKHNDIDEIGYNKYHNTMFEMLGCWSFEGISKKKMILSSFKLLNNIFKINRNDIYVTIFSGDKKYNLPKDNEIYNYWKLVVNSNNIIFCDKKYNFWEMEEIGPCGISTEIHIDTRNDYEKKKSPGKYLVNKKFSKVVEVWNLVFIEYYKKNKKLIKLNKKYIDTGMGLERITMVIQKKDSQYETDIFKPIINITENILKLKYGKNNNHDILIRIIVDHIRSIFNIMIEGLDFSNSKHGYVIRKLLRRVINFTFLFLKIKKLFLYKIVRYLFKYYNKVDSFNVTNKIKDEEILFRNILKIGNVKILKIIKKHINNNDKIISGKEIFKLHDTFGYSVYLSKDIIKNYNLKINMKEFNDEMIKQKRN